MIHPHALQVYILVLPGYLHSVKLLLSQLLLYNSCSLIFDPGESGLSYFRQIFAVKFAHFVMAEIKVWFNT
jgi:hypothetical protein